MAGVVFVCLFFGLGVWGLGTGDYVYIYKRLIEGYLHGSTVFLEEGLLEGTVVVRLLSARFLIRYVESGRIAMASHRYGFYQTVVPFTDHIIMARLLLGTCCHGDEGLRVPQPATSKQCAPHPEFYSSSAEAGRIVFYVQRGIRCDSLGGGRRYSRSSEFREQREITHLNLRGGRE